MYAVMDPVTSCATARLNSTVFCSHTLMLDMIIIFAPFLPMMRTESDIDVPFRAAY